MTMRFGIGSGVVQLAAVALAVALWATGAGAADMRLTISSDDTHPNTINVREMVKAIDQRTKGAVNIKVYSNNALGSPPETTEQTRLGVIDFAILSPSQLDKFNKAFGVVMIPYQFDDAAHAYRTLDQMSWDWFQKKANEVGFEVVANFEWGFRAISNSKRPINKPEDIAGMKLRVPPEIQIKSSMEALGAVTATIAFPEVYMALANKVVDGQDNPLATIHSQKFFEVQSNVAVTNHVYNHMMLVANKRAWDSKLTAEQRAIVTEEARKWGNKSRQDIQDKDKFYIGEMEKAGTKFTYPDVALFRTKMDPAYKAIKAFVGETNWDEWNKFVEASRKK
jgi:tripartite ATP-independent transporter DctP family solute receptor